MTRVREPEVQLVAEIPADALTEAEAFCREHARLIGELRARRLAEGAVAAAAGVSPADVAEAAIRGAT
jgi:hypothetical protein